MWPVYVINMADNQRRMTKAARDLEAAGIPFERFDAIVGRDISAARISEVYDANANRRDFRHPLLPGELGCYLSHIALWQKIVEGGHDGAFLLEDDFEAQSHLKAVLSKLSKDDRPWDLVKLYARRPAAKVVASEKLVEGVDLVEPYQIPNTTLGYAIRRSAAEKLLTASIPFARPIDEDHKRFWEHGLNVRLVVPPPLTLGEESETGDTIASARQVLRGGLRQGLRNLRYRLNYRWNLYLARRGAIK